MTDSTQCEMTSKPTAIEAFHWGPKFYNSSYSGAWWSPIKNSKYYIHNCGECDQQCICLSGSERFAPRLIDGVTHYAHRFDLSDVAVWRFKNCDNGPEACANMKNGDRIYFRWCQSERHRTLLHRSRPPPMDELRNFLIWQ